MSNKIRLKNTPLYGDLLIEFYDFTENGIADFFGGVFGVTNMDSDIYLYRGEISMCDIYPKKINKLNTENKQFVKIQHI